MSCIDIHTHIVPAEFPVYAGRHADVPWPSMRHRACEADVMILGRNYRTVEDGAWSASRRLEAMDASEVTAQVLSPMPELLSYWLPAEDAAVLCEHLNVEIARMMREAPGRFFGLGAVTLQAPDEAARQLERIMRVHGLQGAEIATHVNGTPLGDRRFDPFFAAAEELGAALFVHPLRAPKERLIGPPALEQIVAFPCESALGIASLMTGGMLERHPRLKLAFSHGGGAFALVLPRLQHGWNSTPALREQMPKSPNEYAARISFDTLVYDAPTLRHLVARFGSEKFMLGSDYPFGIAERQPVKAMRAAGFDAAADRAITHGNARGFLNIEGR